MGPEAFWMTAIPLGLCGMLCAWIGVWLVLTRNSMVGDGMSHSVLPGLVLVFVMFGTRAPLAMTIGAAVAALLTVALTQALTDKARVPEDAALGAVFTVFFAAGILMLQRFAKQVDLDPGCVLYGLAEFIPLDTTPILGVELPRALVTILPMSLVVGAVLWATRKELAQMAFDARHAAMLGKRPAALRLALMALVAITVVMSFELVGAILVLALLVAPAAAAQLVTRRLQPMFGWAIAFAWISALGGTAVAFATNTSVSGCVAALAGLLYGGVALGSLRRRAPRLVT